MWPDRRLLDLFGIEVPIIQAPMAGANGSAMAAAVSETGALGAARDDGTALTNLFSGRPARGLMNRLMREIGPMSDKTPAFPTAGGALAPLKKQAEAAGADDFTSLWSGQAAALGREMGTAELTRRLAEDAAARLGVLAAED